MSPPSGIPTIGRVRNAKELSLTIREISWAWISCAEADFYVNVFKRNGGFIILRMDFYFEKSRKDKIDKTTLLCNED